MSKEFIALKLREYREKKGLSIIEVAEIFNKSIKTVYAWENGRSQPDADTLIQLCVLYGIESFEILNEDYINNEEITLKLNNNEQDLIFKFRNLSSEGQNYIMKTINMAINEYGNNLSFQQYQKPTSPTLIAAKGSAPTKMDTTIEQNIAAVKAVQSLRKKNRK